LLRFVIGDQTNEQQTNRNHNPQYIIRSPCAQRIPMRCAQGTSFVSPLRSVVDVRLFVLFPPKGGKQNKQTSHQPQRIQQKTSHQQAVKQTASSAIARATKKRSGMVHICEQKQNAQSNVARATK